MIDLVIVITYFLIMLLMGWRCRRQSAQSYWVANRNYGSNLVAASLVATIFGASSTMGVIGLGYARGLTGAWWSLIGGIMLIPFAIVLAGRIRALGTYTLPDILKQAYGQKVAIPAGMMIVIAWSGIIAAQLVAGGRILSGVFELDFQWALAAVAAVFVLYTFWGGQVSVVKTDAWQMFLFICGILICFILLVLYQGPGPWDKIPEGHFRFPVSDAFGWYDVLVFYPLIVGLPYLVGPDIYSRIFCAKDTRIARRSALMAAAAVIPLSFFLAFFGVLARAKFPEIAPEAALPKTLEIIIPTGLKAVIVVGFLGTIMSSADTCLMSASTILTLNVISPFRHISEDQQLKTTKAVILAVGVVAWFIASQKQGIISSLLMGYTVYVGGVVFPTLATFAQRQLGVTSSGALWAVILGGGAAILGKVNGGAPMKVMLTCEGALFLESALGPMYLSILPVILSVAALLVISRLAQ